MLEHATAADRAALGTAGCSLVLTRGEGRRGSGAGVRRPRARNADRSTRSLHTDAPASVGRGTGRRTPAPPPHGPRRSPLWRGPNRTEGRPAARYRVSASFLEDES